MAGESTRFKPGNKAAAGHRVASRRLSTVIRRISEDDWEGIVANLIKQARFGEGKDSIAAAKVLIEADSRIVTTEVIWEQIQELREKIEGDDASDAS